MLSWNTETWRTIRVVPCRQVEPKVHLRRNVPGRSMTDHGGAPAKAAEAEAVEHEVTARITPSAEFLDRVAKVRVALVERVNAAARARSSPLTRALVAGSAARGTFLQDRLDVDLFLLFPPDLSRDRLREEGLALGSAVLSNPSTRYAEHPYLRGTFEGFTVDAVPGFAITDPSHPLSPVDRTPFHQEYLAARETPPLVEQVRLAKQFFRSLGVYGSEARTEGLSGYLVELLVLRFGSLRKMLLAARDWRVPVRLAEPGKEPPRLPADVALVLADPVDPNRNVASALSRRNVGLFILAAGAYLDRPRPRFFALRADRPLSKEAALALVLARGTHVTVTVLARPDLVDDTLYPQVRKAARAVAEELSRSDFTVLGGASAADPSSVVIVVELAHPRRPQVRVQDGPPAGVDRTGHFLEKWGAKDAQVLQGPYVRPDGSLGVDAHRTACDAEAILLAAFPRLSLGKDLTPKEGSPSVVRTLANADESPALGDALRELLGKRLPWLDET